MYTLFAKLTYKTTSINYYKEIVMEKIETEKALEEAEELIKWLRDWSGLDFKSKEAQAWIDKYRAKDD